MTKLSALTEITEVLDTDYLYVRRASDVGDPDKKVAGGNLRPAGARITNLISFDDDITIPAITTGTSTTFTFAVTGVEEGDFVQINFTNGIPANLGVMDARVSDTDTVELRMRNFAGSDYAGASVPITALLMRVV